MGGAPLKIFQSNDPINSVDKFTDDFQSIYQQVSFFLTNKLFVPKRFRKSGDVAHSTPSFSMPLFVGNVPINQTYTKINFLEIILYEPHYCHIYSMVVFHVENCFKFSVDFTKYPIFHEVEFHEAKMESGDCLFIPFKWYVLS